MKFCSKCGKRFKDSDKFCASCGIELTQMSDEDASSINSMKESFASAADTIGEKAKDVLSDENKQKIKEEVGEAVSAIKNMDVEKGKDMVNSLSSGKKKIIVAVAAIVIVFVGYFFFSPEKQVERAFNNSIDTMVSTLGVPASQWTDSDIDRMAKIYPPKMRDKVKLKLTKQREIVTKNPNRDNSQQGLLMAKMVEGAHVKSVKINGDVAIVNVEGGTGGLGMGTQQMRKIDGEWYLDGIPGTN